MATRSSGRPRSPRLRWEARLLLLALAGGLPASLVALALIWRSEAAGLLPWALTLLVVAPWLGGAVVLRRRIVYPLRTISSLLEGLRNEDYSMRAHRSRPGDTLDDVLREINLLSELLSEQRLSALEATALLRKVMDEIDVAVFAFDPERRLRLVNRAGERMLARPASRLLGRTAEETGLGDWLDGELSGTVERTFPGAAGRWGVRRTEFRQEGVPHQLVVVTDLSRTLRREERQAWQRLIRVLGHELNNSLGPIHSTASTLEELAAPEPPVGERLDDLKRGLVLIRQRAAALSRFMASYSRLARLPAPKLEAVDLAALVRRVAALETRLAVEVEKGSALVVEADPAQIEQLVINLIRNATEAALETGGEVRVRWVRRPGAAEVTVDDSGPGLPESANLFVPFFTTKPDGSGIGLVLSRQIAEAHGGSLTVENRTGGPGCRACLRLPLRALA